jgi:hypothetical protein
VYGVPLTDTFLVIVVLQLWLNTGVPPLHPVGEDESTVLV